MKHVVSSEGNTELNLVFKFRVDDFDRIVDASSQRMTCVGFGMEGHLIPTCQQKQMRHIVVRLAAPGPEQADRRSSQHENEYTTDSV